MIFHLNVQTDNAAFHDEVDGDFSPERELARILRKVAERVESGEDISHYLTIFDENGNDVGRFALEED